MALGLVPWNPARRIVAALAAQQAAVAIAAMLRTLHETEDGPTRHDPQQRTQRTQCPAPEPRSPEIQRNHKNEEEAQPNALPKVGCLKLSSNVPRMKCNTPPKVCTGAN